MTNCRQCGDPLKSGSTVTCLKSSCQEAEYHANMARAKPRRRLKPKHGAKKADGSTWTDPNKQRNGLEAHLIAQQLRGFVFDRGGNPDDILVYDGGGPEHRVRYTVEGVEFHLHVHSVQRD